MILALIGTAAPCRADVVDADSNRQTPEPSPPPPSIEQAQAMLQINSDTPEEQEKEGKKVGNQIRTEAMKEAALSFGARAGLAWRTFQVQRRLAENEGNLSKVYNFGYLLIAAPSGLLIEPPVVSEAQRAVLVTVGGQNAAVADRVYRINRNARIVTAPRNWRAYLERDWGKVDPPARILQPKTEEELAAWREWVYSGWQEGVRQADEIFEADLDRLNADYMGMIRYRELLAQGMITPPYAAQQDRGVVGDANEMRVGARNLNITAPALFNPRSERWITAPR
ncbi:MAG TPA: type IV secretory system conjugative DNA transfer family protein [Alphaproteobacteria bacterium]|nr:type IV secretory system conjugative DNA transfer family protein [Alphaproteobacteria bacterium]